MMLPSPQNLRTISLLLSCCYPMRMQESRQVNDNKLLVPQMQYIKSGGEADTALQLLEL